MNKHVNICIPIEMIDLVDEIIKDKSKGYKSRAEFTKEALRYLIHKYKQ